MFKQAILSPPVVTAKIKTNRLICKGNTKRTIKQQINKKDSKRCPQERNSCTNESKGKNLFTLPRAERSRIAKTRLVTDLSLSQRSGERTRDPSIDKQYCFLIFLGQGCALQTELFPRLLCQFGFFGCAHCVKVNFLIRGRKLHETYINKKDS